MIDLVDFIVRTLLLPLYLFIEVAMVFGFKIKVTAKIIKKED